MVFRSIHPLCPRTWAQLSGGKVDSPRRRVEPVVAVEQVHKLAPRAAGQEQALVIRPGDEQVVVAAVTAVRQGANQAQGEIAVALGDNVDGSWRSGAW